MWAPWTCMFIEKELREGVIEIQEDHFVSGSCGETWWYGRQCFTYQAPWPWIDIIYQELQWKNFIWDCGSGRVTEVGRLSANAKNASLHSLGAYLLFGTKNVVFARITQIATKKIIFVHICKCMGPLLISHKPYLKSASTPSSIPTTTIFTLCYCNLP